MLKPKELFIIMKRVYPQNFLKINFPSHDPVCDDRIRHLNHLPSSIMLLRKVKKLPEWKFEFSQKGRSHGSVKITVSERWVWYRLKYSPDHFNVSRIFFWRPMIRLRQTGRTNDRHHPITTGRVWRYNVKTEMYAIFTSGTVDNGWWHCP